MSDITHTDLQNLNLAIADIKQEISERDTPSQDLLTELSVLRRIRENLSIKIAFSELSLRSLKSALSKRQQSAREAEAADFVANFREGILN